MSWWRCVRAALVCGAIAAPCANAQQTARSAAGFEVSGGIGSLPDGLSSQCGDGGSAPVVEAAASVVYRFERLAFAAVEARAAHTVWSEVCWAVLPPTQTVYPSGYRRNPLYTTTARVGIETPADLPLFRLSIGGGAMWTSPRVPVAVIDLGWSTRGTGARFVVDAERAIAHLQSTEESGAVQITPRPMSSSAGFTTVRLGLEMPIGR